MYLEIVFEGGYASYDPEMDEMIASLALLLAFGSGNQASAADADCGRITVLDQDRKPVSEAKVTFSLGADAAGPYWDWHTDATGTLCATELQDKRGFVRVEAPERLGGACAGSTQLPWTPPRGRGHRVAIHLPIHPVRRGPVEGVVLSRSRRPVAGAQIEVLSVERASQDACPVVPPIHATSNAAGSFTLAEAPLETIRLQVTHPDFATRVLDEAAGSAPLTVVLDQGATWKGKVLLPDGRPLDQCDIAVAGLDDRTVAQSHCGPAGFSFAHLPEGEVVVDVRVGLQSPLGKRVLRRRMKFTDGATTTADLRWPSGSPIQGQVVDSAGSPVPGARVLAVRVGAPDSENGAPHGVLVDADASGHFTIADLAAGKWVLESDDRESRRTKVTVPAGTTNVRIVVPVPSGGDKRWRK